MNTYSLAEISDEIRAYNIKQIIDSGENDMLDNKIDKKALEECLTVVEEKKEDESLQIDISKTLEDIDERELFESIINLKDKK